MNPWAVKLGKEALDIIAREAREYAVKHYSNPLARKLAEWSYRAQAKAKSKREGKR